MVEREGGGEGEEETEMAMLDFDMLCAAVAAAASAGAPAKESAAAVEEEEGFEVGHVQRMWEGGLLDDCFEDRRIAIETTCCPCYRFGKNMRRAKLGSCFLQGAVYFVLRISALISLIIFFITRNYNFLYFGAAFSLLVGFYLGYFRTRIRKQFNIKGRDSTIDDCVSHLICPCCTLCQESRTLEMNNVQNGVWHGRGDTICLMNGFEGNLNNKSSFVSININVKSPELCSMERESNESEPLWDPHARQTDPLVQSE